MPRPSAAQVCLGSFTVVATAVALLAVSGAEGVLAVTVLVAVALALGTVVTVLALSSSSAAAGPGTAEAPRAAQADDAAPTGPERAYARQR
ncbi:hypothetical protein GCM10018790_44330 [Kitasatospora xanthocidica]|uniref:hypothetical protein n=1 Tax=Kitasatospora xanthocidica TaxID=83382 RepID=UPI001672DBBA|nr:hypothetical protein [Kitasatospora xanthocidica]GHF61551.1 hypothetical protein GCM10018790_44330 [Kitasatospora xanthocidica]